MEAGNSAARDRDEREWEELPGKDRPFARCGERRKRRHPQGRQDDEDRHAEHQDGRDLQERREIVTRAEQHPDGQHRRDEAVRDHHAGERRAAVRERRGQTGVARDAAAADQREQQQQRADDGCFADFAGPPPFHPPTHEQRDRNRAGDREQPPRRCAQGIDDDERQDGEQDDHDREDRDHRRHAGDVTDLLLGHLAERLAIAAQRAEENREVLDRAAEHHADDEPQGPWEEAELRRKHGSNEWSGPGNRGEVVTEQHPAVGRDKIVAIVESLGGGGAARIEPEDLGSEEFRVEAVADDVGADGGGQKPGGTDRLAASQCQDAECRGAEQGDQRPANNRERSHAA